VRVPAVLPGYSTFLGLRAKDEANVSSAEAVLGEPPVLPGQLSPDLPPPRAEDHPIIPSTIRSYADVAAGLPSALQGAKFAYVRREPAAGPLEPAYRGPYCVLGLRAKTVKLQVGEKEEWFSVDRVKPHHGEAAVTPASPP